MSVTQYKANHSISLINISVLLFFAIFLNNIQAQTTAKQSESQKKKAQEFYQYAENFRIGLNGFTANEDSMKHYLKLACDAGSADAQYLIGIATITGLEQPKDQVKGLELLIASAEQYNKSALEALTKLYSDSSSFRKSKLPKNLEQRIAFIHARKSAELGSIQGAEYLGNAYRLGIGCEKNDTLAIVWMKTAALKGKATAQLTLAEWYFNGENPALKCDLSKAHRFYSLLAKNRFADIDQQAEGRIGVFYTEQMLRLIVNMHYMLPLSSMSLAPQLRVRP